VVLLQPRQRGTQAESRRLVFESYRDEIGQLPSPWVLVEERVGIVGCRPSAAPVQASGMVRQAPFVLRLAPCAVCGTCFPAIPFFLAIFSFE
jgi:hypothetical protein